MIKFEDIRAKLTEEWHSGVSQSRLAQKYGINQQNICKIISGQTEGKKVSLDFLNRLFPHCSLGGEISIGDNSPSQINSPLASMGLDNERMQRVMAEIIRSDIPSEAKDKVLNIILNTK